MGSFCSTDDSTEQSKHSTTAYYSPNETNAKGSFETKKSKGPQYHGDLCDTVGKVAPPIYRSSISPDRTVLDVYPLGSGGPKPLNHGKKIDNQYLVVLLFPTGS